MAILVYTESEQGKFKKIAFELASYARAIADKNNTTVTAVCINAENPIELQNVTGSFASSFSAKKYAAALAQVASEKEASLVVVSSSANSKYLAPLLAVKLSAAYTSNVVELPSNYSPLTVKRSAFTNKAFESTQVNTENVLISLAKNSFIINEIKSNATIEDFSVNVVD